MASINRRGALVTAAGAGAGVALGSVDAAAREAQPRWSAKRPLRVHLVAFDGVEELDLFGPLEVLAGAAAMGHPVTVRLVTSGQPGRVTCGFGTEVAVPGAWEPRAADVVVVPGGGFRQRDGAGIWAEINKGVLLQALRRASARPSLTLVGVCTGVIVLHSAGLIGARPCTTHQGAKPYLRGEGADVRDVRVVDDGNLVCAGGVSSGIDAALWLLEREIGSKAAADVEYLLEFERRGTALRTGRVDNA
ncbi:DJ-1/PfpI family protein [Streptomyces albipurpureus]|uniref:DJ-1/PfpI family protein n=1 Tax=Streptomyces albipurpureus TaxID=2897419 RepID=A0ABT0UX71_9ACTN|nr:DJ-1/PfpI family protein [Streptomyces sp. CWNU-1]MCM2392544.1 DJ-1/PfpI family protein [Streptomyces sp. CWNU-1]